MKKGQLIDKKYCILEKLGHGGTADVFLVKKEPTSKEMYAAKVLKEDNKKYIYYFNREIKILKSLNNPYIINLIDSGAESISKDNKPIERKYLILEYAEKYDLYSYLRYTHGFGEKYAKFLFYKILKGVEACHNAGICHRDLKTNNILVDENCNPKICDFGFSIVNTGHLKEYCGTKGYRAPEVEKENPKYDGIKADIFSLGVVLFVLVTGVNGFDDKNNLYSLIRIRDYDYYWEIVEGVLKAFSPEFKKLYNKMVCYDPEERLSVKDILNEEGNETDYDWLKEIREMRDLDKDAFASLEEEVKKEINRRKIEVDKAKKITENKESENNNNIGGGGGNKSITDEKVYFDSNRKPKNVETEIYMDNYIKINGNLSPIKFMNDLVNYINKNLGDDCIIDVPERGLKFNITFEEEEKGGIVLPKEIEEKLAKLNSENGKEKANLDVKQCILQVKLFKLLNGGHLLRFLKKSGELDCYYDIVEKISNLVKEIL